MCIRDSSITTQLKLGGFNVLRIKSYCDEKNQAYLFFLLDSIKISKNYSKNGPEFFRESDCNNFIYKNIKKTQLMWINSDKKIISIEKRKFNDVVKFTNEFIKKNLQTGIPKGLQNDFKKGFKVFVGNRNLSKSIKEANLDLISTDGTIFYFN
jgi:tRNA nucleotidyltransferase (CCA-adding enzyme)